MWRVTRHHAADRDRQPQIRCIPSSLLVPTARLAILRPSNTCIAEGAECTHVPIRHHYYGASLPAIASVRTTTRNEFLPVERHAPIATATSDDRQLHKINHERQPDHISAAKKESEVINTWLERGDEQQ